MFVDELVYMIQYKQLENLIPITDIKTDRDVEKYRGIGYNTVKFEKFQEKFPELNKEIFSKLYYEPLPIDGILYYDLDNIILFSAGIYINDNKIFQTAKDKDIKKVIIDYVESIEAGRKKDYVMSFLSIPEAYTLEIIIKCFNKIPSEYKYETFIHYYTSLDFGSYHLNESIINKIIKSKSEEQREETRNNLDKLTDKDVIKIYRGVGDKGNLEGYSYSLSFDVARFFAFKNSIKANYVTIIEGEVKKEDVIEVITDTSEYELLICPDRIMRKAYVEYYGIEEMIDQNEDIMEQYEKEKNKRKYIYEKLKIGDKRQEEHGEQHMLRVLFLTMLITYNCLLDEDDGSTQTLFDAAMFHDIGRENDGVDEEHGAKSYQRLCEVDERYKENKLLENLMKYHCIEDETVWKEWRDASEEDKLLLNILKDADALDRQRFGLESLSTKYLRLKDISYELLFASYQLTNCIM